VTAVVLRGDARALPLPDGCVDLICTSPPYWALRSYSDNGEHYDGQIGSEATPAEYLAALLECTREWVRVLKPSGSLFVDLGDKYATRYSSTRGGGRAGLNGDDDSRGRSGQNHTGAGEKSLLGLPWRYALACMDQLGLILRRDIIWSKPNGLPESVTDRCRSSHEYLFHFTVQPRYYAAVDEIREPHTMRPQRRPNGRPDDLTPRQGQPKQTWPTAQRDEVGVDGHPLGKLPGSVWDIPSQPLTVPAALGVDHFAAFPMELPRRCVLGWSPPGVCTACGEGRRPIAERASRERHNNGRHGPTGLSPDNTHGKYASTLDIVPDYRITGYACACSQDVPLPGRDVTADGSTATTYRDPAEDRAGQGHLPPTRPALVVDPFAGTGTTMLVASALGRIGIGVDRSADYCRLAKWRTSDPGELAKALQVEKPPAQANGQEALFDRQEALWG
jgi:DNA modification methylase